MPGREVPPEPMMVRMLEQDEVATRRGELERFLAGAIGSIAAGRIAEVDREAASTMTLACKASGYVTTVAEEHGELVGLLVGRLERDRSTAFVRWVVVLPENRRRGIGRLLADSFDDLVGEGLVQGVVDLDDPVAVAFWTRRDWKPLLEPRRRVPMGKKVGTEFGVLTTD